MWHFDGHFDRSGAHVTMENSVKQFWKVKFFWSILGFFPEEIGKLSWATQMVHGNRFSLAFQLTVTDEKPVSRLSLMSKGRWRTFGSPTIAWAFGHRICEHTNFVKSTLMIDLFSVKSFHILESKSSRSFQVIPSIRGYLNTIQWILEENLEEIPGKRVEKKFSTIQ